MADYALYLQRPQLKRLEKLKKRFDWALVTACGCVAPDLIQAPCSLRDITVLYGLNFYIVECVGHGPAKLLLVAS